MALSGSIFESVAVERIDLSDDTFRITTGRDDSDLIRSIETVGLVTPPILMPSRGRFAVVSGFRRIAACRRLDVPAPLCRRLAEDTPLSAAALIAVADNTSHRRLNPVELSRAHRLLARALGTDEAVSSAAAGIGLPAGTELIEKLRGLDRAPEAIRSGVVQEHIALPVALDLAKMPTEEACALAEVLSSVPLSLNRQREVVTLLREIARREDLDVLDLTADSTLAGIVGDEDADLPRKAKALVSFLKRRRYPALCRAQREFERRRRQLPLSGGMALAPPANFEGNRYELKLSFRSVEELEAHLARAGEIAGTEALRAIVEGG